MSRSRIALALAFACAGITLTVAIMASGVVQTALSGDRGYLAVAMMVPLFGLPYILAALLAAYAAYRVARSLGRVNGRVAVGVGLVGGAAVALLLRAPLLPLWAACLVGAATGAVWWQVLNAAPPARSAT